MLKVNPWLESRCSLCHTLIGQQVFEGKWSALADDFRTFVADATWPLPLSDSLVQVFEPRPVP